MTHWLTIWRSEKVWLTLWLTTWNQEMLAHLKSVTSPEIYCCLAGYLHRVESTLVWSRQTLLCMSHCQAQESEKRRNQNSNLINLNLHPAFAMFLRQLHIQQGRLEVLENRDQSQTCIPIPPLLAACWKCLQPSWKPQALACWYSYKVL